VTGAAAFDEPGNTRRATRSCLPIYNDGAYAEAFCIEFERVMGTFVREPASRLIFVTTAAATTRGGVAAIRAVSVSPRLVQLSRNLRASTSRCLCVLRPATGEFRRSYSPRH